MNFSQEEIQRMRDTMSPPEIKTLIQNDALQFWVDNGYRSIIEGATGVGKTRIAVLAAKRELESNPKAVIYIGVPTETLRDTTWPAEFVKWGCEDIIGKVTLVCHVSMEKVFAGEIDLFIWDECHHVTPSNSIFFTNNKVYKMLFLTATVPKAKKYGTGADKKITLTGLCPTRYVVTLEQAIFLNLIANFKVKVMLFDLDKSDMYVSGGTKARPTKTTEAAHYAYLTKMIQKCMYGARKNPGAMFSWVQKRSQLLFNLKSKKTLAKKTMGLMISPENRTLIFCGSIEQSIELCGENIFNSKTDSTYLSKFQAKEINHLGVVNALDEGENVNDLDQSLIIQLNSNERSVIQRIGRTVRWREGHEALIVVLVAKGTADEKWYKSAFENFDKSRITEYYVKVN